MLLIDVMNLSNRPRPLLASLVAVALLAISAVALAAPKQPRDARDLDVGALRAHEEVPLSEPAFGTYLGACAAAGDCSSGLYCYAFKKHGAHCTKTCAADSDCAAPSKGCSERHQCALPE